MTLEQYFEKAWKCESYPLIDHTLRIQKRPDGKFTFYIHPAHEGGDTANFVVEGNLLTQLH